MQSGVAAVPNKNEYQKLLEKGGKVVVDFNASWCSACKAMKPVFDKLSKDHDDVVFLSVDVDQATDIASDEHIRSMPTFKFIENGKVVEEVVGANKQKLESTMDSFTS
ncbi:hypothetical protein H4R20_005479 [Coemansia guatemalensis]|uniref:Thioredoxin n=1 Tax=Coemansia guatemalensis TaxID=2761395 RepID=A0A9W8LRT5_9FUNG|nr:hypothetical protein H4R20_005479 [Coemansia guatemalensis]